MSRPDTLAALTVLHEWQQLGRPPFASAGLDLLVRRISTPRTTQPPAPPVEQTHPSADPGRRSLAQVS